MAEIRPSIQMMLDHQAEMQRASFGTDYRTMNDEQRMEVLRMNVLALEDELHEALAETGWKPWAESNHINVDAFKGELVDAWHFFMNLLNLAGMDAQELHHRYFEKAAKNKARQEQGYDGISGKCPLCHRALDDPATPCYVGPIEGFVPVDENYVSGFCTDSGNYTVMVG